MLSLVSLWTEVRRRLEAAGVDSPVFDARLLVEAGAGVARHDIITDPRRELSAAQIAAVRALAERRAAREPMAHILGVREFWKQALTVNRDVLIPRPETEFVVEAALEALPLGAPARVLDLGVGSGAILLAILADRPLASGLGVDLSAAALDVARANAAALGLAPRARFVAGDWAGGIGESFDVVVANPPYIPAGEIDGLGPEIAFEPRLALDGGADGLSAYRSIISSLAKLLRPGGAYAFEVGQGQAEAVAGLLEAAGAGPVRFKADLAGIARVAHGVWRENA